MPRLKVATYNIHCGIGRDGRFSETRVRDVLREIDADVIGLQEIDARPGPGTDSEQMEFLARRLGLTAVAGPTIVRHDGTYGNALLTRRPLRAVRSIDLTYYRREPRRAIDADLEIDGAVVRVIVTHLGLLPRERRWQVKQLLGRLADERSDAVVMCGDFNEWLGFGRPLRWLQAAFGRSPAARTFPARLPLLALDRIWVPRGAALLAADAHGSAKARAASDHLPYVADIRLARAPDVARL
jgi:endonuclease/exonuclease/phosphatase family metal-dependent hydrolase